MDDPLLVGEMDAPGRVPQDPRERAKVVAGITVKRPAVDELHRDVVSLAVLAHVVDRGDVRMGQLAGEARLLLEPGDLVPVLSFQELERDPAGEFGVPRLPDLAHAAGAQLRRADVFPEAGLRRGVGDLGRDLRDADLGRPRLRRLLLHGLLEVLGRQVAAPGQELAQLGKGRRAGPGHLFELGQALRDPRLAHHALLHEETGQGQVGV